MALTPTDSLMPSERDRILHAMSELCAMQGYGQTTLEQTIERAGVSPERFEELIGGDKEECAVALENAIIAEVVAAVSGSYSPDRSELDSAVLGVKAILELMAANPSYACFGYVVCRHAAPRRCRDAREAAVKVMSALIEQLTRFSGSDQRPASAGLAALGSAEAVIGREVAAGRAEELPRLLPDFVYTATVPFLGQEEALRLTRLAHELLRESAWG